MQKLTRTFVVFLALILFSFVATAAEVCRSAAFSGFKMPAIRAAAFLPAEKTHDPAKACVYVEKVNGVLYFHSNFITNGFNYPTKIASDTIHDGAKAFVNIVHSELPSNEVWEQTEQIFRDHVRVFIDESVFDSNGIPNLDLANVKNITVVNGRRKSILSDTNLELLNRDKPPPLIMGKILGCCLFGVPPHRSIEFKATLENCPIETSQIRLLSLVRDSATKSAISELSTLKGKQLAESGAIVDIAGVEKVFVEARGKTVFLVGHVEGDHFITRNAKDEVTLDVPIATVRSLAKKHDVELIALGCKTAQRIKEDTFEVGVTTDFNTVDAVRSLDRAMKTSNNYASFLESLTSDGLKVVIDPIFVEKTELRAEFFSKMKTKNESIWIRIAELYISFRAKS
ncbi:MAG: hypothetical protein LM514_04780 [Streptococcus sp.]|nr:hypothetical protein [Streptococcus sp.]